MADEEIVETPAEDSLHADLEAAFDAVEPVESPDTRVRDEAGRFAAANKSTPAPAQPVKAGTVQQAPLAPARPERPSSWKKEMWTHWDTLSPEVASYIRQREDEANTGVHTYKQKHDELWNEIAPYEQLIRSEGGTPALAIRDLLKTAATLRTADPQTKLQLFGQLAQRYGVPLQGMMPQGVNPHAQWTVQQLQELRGELNSFKSSREQEQQAVVQQEIKKFAQDHPHLDEVRETMAGLLQSNLAQDLESAYEKACRMNDDIWQKVQAEQASAQQSGRIAQARQGAAQARAKAVSPKSATPSAAPTQARGNGIRETLEAAFDEFGGRV